MAAQTEFHLTFSFPDLNPESRLRELMLYIADKCKEDPKFGAAKLNKILYFADFISFSKRGVPITGAEYMRLGKGPAPKHLVPVRVSMEKAGELKVVEGEYYGYPQKRPVPNKSPDLKAFSPGDLSIVDQVIRLLWDKTRMSAATSRTARHGKLRARRKASRTKLPTCPMSP